MYELHPPSSKLIFLGITALLYLFCYQIWGLGVTCTDDANWLLSINQHKWGIITQWAVQQGRIFAFVSGTIMYIALKLQNTLAGNVLRIGSFIVFFIAFYAIIARYFGRRLSLLAAVLNLALFVMHWESSLIINYPAFAWILNTFFIIGMVLGRRYQASHNRADGTLALLFFFVSLFQHEGMLLLLPTIFICSIFANHRSLFQQKISYRSVRAQPTTYRLTLGAFAMTLLYFLLYVGWRLCFPSQYAGNMLTTFHLSRIFSVLLSFCCSGSIIFDLFHPYKMLFLDPVLGDIFLENYSIFSFISAISHSPLTVFVGGIVGLLLFYCLAPANIHERFLSKQKALMALGVGFLIVLLPILPVALTFKYQQAYFDYGVRSYVYTPFCHFGMTLLMAVLLLITLQLSSGHRLLNPLIKTACVLALVFFAMVGHRMNTAITHDLQLEAGRWKMFDQALRLSRHLRFHSTIFYAPRLKSISWLAMIDENYWSNYAKARHHQNIIVKKSGLSLQDVAAGAEFFDYFKLEGATVSLLAQLNLQQSTVTVNDLAIAVDGAFASDLSQYAIIYHDLIKGDKYLRLINLPMIGKNNHLRRLSNMNAVPHSIHIVRYPQAINFLKEM